MKMDNEKKTILSKLYSLRAGLSLIDEQNDILKKEEDKVDKINEEVTKNQKTIEEKTVKKEGAEASLVYSEKYFEDAKRHFSEHKQRGVFGLDFLPLMLFFAVVGVIISAVYNAATDKGFSWWWAVGGAIFGYIFLRITNAKNDKRYGTTKNYEKQIQESENRLLNDKRIISDCADEIDKCEKQNAKMKNDKKTAVQIYNEQAEIIVPTVKAMYEALDEEYNSIIDKRDWANLDLLIYYFETNRVDTIREALLLADRQRQTDTLVSAINDARAEICKTVNTSIERLREDMNNNFKALGSAIRSQHQAQMNAINKMNANISRVGAQVGSRLDAIATNGAMQNALLAKINVSTSNLAKTAENIYYNGVRPISY